MSLSDTPPEFIDADADVILQQIKDYYQSLSNKPLLPAQTEALILHTFASREKDLRDQFNAAACQMLIRFASGDILDELCALLGVERLAPTYASGIGRYEIKAGAGANVIPAGSRVLSNDGKVYFATLRDAITPDNSSSSVSAFVTVDLAATTAGVIGNGYTSGQITQIVDPYGFVVGFTNTTTTVDGADQESDIHLAQRFMLAPSRFSTAGPIDAYVYYALSAHPLIVDARIPLQPTAPGRVDIYILMKNGQVPSQQILNTVQAVCSADKVRPLNDEVIARAASAIHINITVELTLYNGAPTQDVLNTVNANLAAYSTSRIMHIGIDAVVNQIRSLCIIPGQVYDANVLEPGHDTIASDSQFVIADNINATVVAYVNG